MMRAITGSARGRSKESYSDWGAPGTVDTHESRWNGWPLRAGHRLSFRSSTLGGTGGRGLPLETPPELESELEGEVMP